MEHNNEKKTHKKIIHLGGTPKKIERVKPSEITLKKIDKKNKIVKFVVKKISMFVKEQRIALNQVKTRKNLFRCYSTEIEAYLSIALYNDKKLLYPCIVSGFSAIS